MKSIQLLSCLNVHLLNLFLNSSYRMIKIFLHMLNRRSERNELGMESQISYIA